MLPWTKLFRSAKLPNPEHIAAVFVDLSSQYLHLVHISGLGAPGILQQLTTSNIHGDLTYVAANIPSGEIEDFLQILSGRISCSKSN